MASFGGFSFNTGTSGTPATSASNTGFSFGSNSANTTGGIQFTTGSNQQPTPASAALGSFSFGSGAPPAASISNPLLGSTMTSVAVVNPLLGGGMSNSTSTVPSTSASFSFTAGKAVGTAAPISVAATTPAAPASSLSGFSFGSTQGLTSSSSTGGFSLGGVNSTGVLPTSSSTLGGFSFGSALQTHASSASSAPFNFPGTSCNVANSSAPSFTGLGGASVASVTSASSSTLSIGLGGAQPPATSAADAVCGKVEGKPSKETPLPQEIFASIAAFEEFKSIEKTASEANLRESATAFHKLGDDCRRLRSHVTELATAHDSLQHKVNAIKEKIIWEGDDIEMARRTHTTPVHIQGDNTAPEQYFNRALENFESHMLLCKQRIEEVEKCLAVASCQGLNDEIALKELVRRQHEDLQLAAAHVYQLHSKLVQLSDILPCPEHMKPRPLFRSGAGDLSKLDSETTRSAVPNESGIIRSCFDLPGGESRLGTFQQNVAKAKASSINPAPPPTQPLQSLLPLFGTSFCGTGRGLQTNNAFLPSSNTSAFGNTFEMNNAFNSGANFGGSNVTQTGSLFSSTFGQTNKIFKR